MNLRLLRPSLTYRVSALRGIREFQSEGLPWWTGGDLERIEHDFAAFVERKLAEANPTTGPFVPATQLWAVTDDETFVGRISIRHELNDALRAEGGHIGYDTVPSFRRRGVATEMLRQALPIARTLGLAEVLITCDDTNEASMRVIENNGGVLLEKRTLAPDRPPKCHYRITLR